MSSTTTKKPSNKADSTAFIVRINLKQLLTEEQAKSFAEQAEKHGRTIKEHFIAITLGENKTTAA